jgi:hypothetical protein
LHDKLSTDEISKDMAEGVAWSEDQAVEEAYLGSRPTIGTSLTSSPNKTG